MRIIYLDIDTLRPDHLGCYGYHRDTSPNIDQIAEEGVRFEKYYCSDAPCLPSRTALMTGQFGIHTGVVNHGGRAADLRREGSTRRARSKLSKESLPGFLREAGLNTALFSPFAERHGSWNFYAGFNEIHNFGGQGMTTAEEVTPAAIDWLEKNGDEDNWFLHLNYWDPHTPYRAPEDFGNPFADQPIPDWYDEEMLAEHRKLVGPHKPKETAMYDNRELPQYPRFPSELKDMDDLKQLIDGYDCGINYMDQYLGQIFDYLKELGVYEDTVIIISSDHGENMGELGIYGEHGTADHATCRIPMIIKWPEGQKGHVDSEFHYNLDLAPTLAELLERESAAGWDGDSYAPTIIEGSDCGRDHIIISQCAHVVQRGVLFGDWLYTRTYHDGYHLFPKHMLYNLAKDPYEQDNIADQYPEKVQEATLLLSEWHDQMMQTMPYENKRDPLWTVMEEGGPYYANGKLTNYVEYLKISNRENAIP